MKCNPVHIPCCFAMICFVLSISSGIIYIVSTHISETDNHFGEIAIYTIVVTLVLWIINVNIQEDNKEDNKRSSTKVTPVKPVKQGPNDLKL